MQMDNTVNMQKKKEKKKEKNEINVQTG